MAKLDGATLLHVDRDPETILFYDEDDAEAWVRKYAKMHKCEGYTFKIKDQYDFSDVNDRSPKSLQTSGV